MAPNPLQLLEPKDCALLLVDQQAGLAFGVGSIDRQVLMNNVVARKDRDGVRSACRRLHLGDESVQRAADAGGQVGASRRRADRPAQHERVGRTTRPARPSSPPVEAA